MSGEFVIERVVNGKPMRVLGRFASKGDAEKAIRDLGWQGRAVPA